MSLINDPVVPFEPLHEAIADFALVQKEREDSLERLRLANEEMRAASANFKKVEEKFVKLGARLQRERNRAFDLHPWTEADQSAWIGI